MSAVKDFFQNVGSVLTFGLIPPAMPDIPELSETDFKKFFGDNPFSTDQITKDVETIFKDLNFGDPGSGDQPTPLPTDTPAPSSYSPPSTYIPNGPMYPYK